MRPGSGPVGLGRGTGLLDEPEPEPDEVGAHPGELVGAQPGGATSAINQIDDLVAS